MRLQTHGPSATARICEGVEGHQAKPQWVIQQPLRTSGRAPASLRTALPQGSARAAGAPGAGAPGAPGIGAASGCAGLAASPACGETSSVSCAPPGCT